MTTELEIGLYIFILAGFLGYHLIMGVPPLLHTPLMSATNAMSGISLIGSLVAGAGHGALHTWLGFVAVGCSTTNVVGGFIITDRMLRMFRESREQTPQGLSASQWAGAVGTAILLGFVWIMSELRATAPGSELEHVLRLFYIGSAVLFVLALKGLSSPKWARKGMFAAEFGMAMALAGTLFHPAIVEYRWILAGLAIGSVAGASMGLWIPMTAVPQRTALSHSLGALAATLVGISEYIRHFGGIERVLMTTLGAEVVIGGLTFTGSLMAAAKLQGLLPGHPVTYKGQNASNLALLASILVCLVLLVADPSRPALFFYGMVAMALLFGSLLVVPIGAADMPVVISLLNSYAGLADASMGFVLMNKIQIITGSLDGTSGFLLSLLMCRAMNRSAMNVLFGAFGKIQPEKQVPAAQAKGTVIRITPEEARTLFDNARSIIVVPGYGMAVAQAQFAVSELAKVLQKRGIDVKYAIHPVAGRMPGHMNVLLAEANVPYDRLYEMEQINPYFAQADVALVVGANDVTNPAARTNKASPLYGMPILEVDRAKAIIVLKRSLRPGFSGVDNELYYNPKCMMLFGDARESLNQLLSMLKR